MKDAGRLHHFCQVQGAYDVTQAQIKQLRDTGMNWKTIAAFLGVSKRTLSHKKIAYRILHKFLEITDEELDNYTEHILQLTSYSGKVYIIGTLFKEKK